MNTTIRGTVVAVKEGDKRLNFNFVTEDSGEQWCIGSLKCEMAISIKVGDTVILEGEWTRDFYGRRCCFFAEDVRLAPSEAVAT
jgi:hypothetical protein